VLWQVDAVENVEVGKSVWQKFGERPLVHLRPLVKGRDLLELVFRVHVS
jgi:hypothetical protein